MIHTTSNKIRDQQERVRDAGRRAGRENKQQPCRERLQAGHEILCDLGKTANTGSHSIDDWNAFETLLPYLFALFVFPV